MTYQPRARRLADDESRSDRFRRAAEFVDSVDDLDDIAQRRQARDDFAVSRTPARPETYRDPDRPYAWVGQWLQVAACTVGGGAVVGGLIAAAVAIWQVMS